MTLSPLDRYGGACRLLSEVLCRALDGCPRAKILTPAVLTTPLTPRIDAIATGTYLGKPRDRIRGTRFALDRGPRLS